MIAFGLVLTVLVAVSSAAPAVDTSLDGIWEAYKVKFNKKYEATEERIRRVIFEENVAKIRRHNLEHDLGLHTYTLGINKIADLTNKEYRETVLGISKLRAPQCPSTFSAPLNVNDYPTSVDWRTQGYVTPIKDQEQCGSCWAFSATAAMEGQWFRKTGTLVSLSEQQLVDCSQKYGDEGCNGGWMDWAFEYIKDYQQETEADYPYMGVDQDCAYDKTKTKARNSGCSDIKSMNETDLLRAVATIGPISVAIDASADSFQLYKSGIYVEDQCSTTMLDHGVTVVGYDATSKGKYWTVKNSWGTSWGMQGYILMARDHSNMCGISTAASYPLV
jgi:cathepsin L